MLAGGGKERSIMRVFCRKGAVFCKKRSTHTALIMCQSFDIEPFSSVGLEQALMSVTQ